MNCMILSVVIIIMLIIALLYCGLVESTILIVSAFAGVGAAFTIALVIYGFSPSDVSRAEKIGVSPVVIEIMKTINPDPDTNVLNTWENGYAKGLTNEEIMKWIAPQLTDEDIDNILKVGEI